MAEWLIRSSESLKLWGAVAITKAKSGKTMMAKTLCGKLAGQEKPFMESANMSIISDSVNGAKITSITNERIEFKVPSSRGGYHIVSYADGAWSCTCEDHYYRHRICKHIREAKHLLSHFTTKAIESEEVY